MAGEFDFPPMLPKPVVVRLCVYMISGFIGMLLMFSPAGFVQGWGLAKGLLIWLAAFIPVVTICVLTFFSFKSLANKANRFSYRLCPSCAEPFETADPVHTCTRCDRKINTCDARGKWRRLALQSAYEPFGPTLHMGKRFPGSRVLRYFIVALLFATPASQVIGMYVKSTPRTVNVPIVVRSNSGNPVTLQQPTQVPRSTLERTAAYTNSYAPLIAGAGLAAYALFAIGRFSRSTKKAKEHNYLVCGQCLYPLDTCPEKGNCPECGTEYEAHNLRCQWFRVIAQKEIHEAYKSGEIDEFMPL